MLGPFALKVLDLVFDRELVVQLCLGHIALGLDLDDREVFLGRDIIGFAVLDLDLLVDEAVFEGARIQLDQQVTLADQRALIDDIDDRCAALDLILDDVLVAGFHRARLGECDREWGTLHGVGRHVRGDLRALGVRRHGDKNTTGQQQCGTDQDCVS